MPSIVPEGITQPLHVAVGVIEQEGRILITRRADDLHQGGKWEFPGGKVEPGESVQEALARELDEELGITPQAIHSLIQIPWKYHDRHVLLDVWRVSRFSGTPHPREGQPMSWVEANQLEGLNFPDANRPIIRALNLPDQLLITPEPTHQKAFLSELEAILRRGVIKLLLFRAKTLEPQEYQQMARAISELAASYDIQLVLSGGHRHEALGHDVGYHLSSAQLMEMSERQPRQGLLSAACHNLREIQQANRLGVDFILLSPVQHTLSHPGARPLGWEGFQLLTEQACMPVYALGGLSSEDVATAQAHGAQGIAAIRGLWSDERT